MHFDVTRASVKTFNFRVVVNVKLLRWIQGQIQLLFSPTAVSEAVWVVSEWAGEVFQQGAVRNPGFSVVSIPAGPSHVGRMPPPVWLRWGRAEASRGMLYIPRTALVRCAPRKKQKKSLTIYFADWVIYDLRLAEKQNLILFPMFLNVSVCLYKYSPPSLLYRNVNPW